MPGKTPLSDWVKEAFNRIKDLDENDRKQDIRLERIETRNKVLSGVFSGAIAILTMIAMYLMFFKK